GGWTGQTDDDTKATALRKAVVTSMADISRQMSDADQRRAQLQQHCAFARMFTLNALRPMARKLTPPDIGAYFTNRMRTLLVYGNNGTLNLTAGPILVNSFAQDLGADQTPGTMAIQDIGLSWGTIRVVEFGHQCQPCELNQGSLDMCGRFDDAVKRY